MPTLIAPSVPELRRLLTRLLWVIKTLPEHIWAWSLWRRRKQLSAKRSHYRRRGLVLDKYLRL